jgi:hypothetical protein
MMAKTTPKKYADMLKMYWMNLRNKATLERDITEKGKR